MRITELRNLFLNEIKAATGCDDASYMEFQETTCGDKQIMGHHVTISFLQDKLDQPMKRKVKIALLNLTARYHADVTGKVKVDKNVRWGASRDNHYTQVAIEIVKD